MKNLIDDIEKMKSYYQTDISCEFNDGWNNALDKAIKILNQHNIITAPKSIKLSEIVEKLNEEYKEKPIFQRWTKNYKTIHLENRGGMFELSNNKIHEIYLFRLTSKTRWLYALWIAGTEIVDDLEGDE